MLQEKLQVFPPEDFLEKCEASCRPNQECPHPRPRSYAEAIKTGPPGLVQQQQQQRNDPEVEIVTGGSLGGLSTQAAEDYRRLREKMFRMEGQVQYLLDIRDQSILSRERSGVILTEPRGHLGQTSKSDVLEYQRTSRTKKKDKVTKLTAVVIIAVVESHLRKEVETAEIVIEGFSLLRVDRIEDIKQGALCFTFETT